MRGQFTGAEDVHEFEIVSVGEDYISDCGSYYTLNSVRSMDSRDRDSCDHEYDMESDGERGPGGPKGMRQGEVWKYEVDVAGSIVIGMTLNWDARKR